MELKNIIHLNKSISLDDIKIHSIIPVYDTKEVLIITKEHPKRSLPSLKCNWGSGRWMTMKKITTKDDGYGWFGAYSSNMPENLINVLLRGDNVEIQLKRNTEITAQIFDHGLRPKENPLTVVESLNPIFLSSSEHIRKKTIANFNKHCGSILRRLLPWIEFHLMHGVDQIFINQPMRYQKNGETWGNFWKELLHPYLDSGEVILVMFDDMAEMAQLNKFGGTNLQPSHSNISKLWNLWMNKGRSIWFGGHDLDEYIVPAKTGYYEKENIASILKSLPEKTNYVHTRMFMVEAPTSNKILLAGNVAATDFMPKCQKCLFRTNDVNLVWDHGVTNWENPMQGAHPEPLRINHYRLKTDDGWIPTEAATIKKWNKSSIPHVTEERLTMDHSIILDKIKQRYNMTHGEFLRYMQKKHSHLKELGIQNLAGE